MDNFTLFLLMGGFGGGGEGGGAGGLISFLPFVAIIAIFYFFMIRPQRKKQKETQRMLDELRKGDRVVTIGGIHGVIQNVREKTVIVKVDENCKLEFLRTAIASVDASSRNESAENAG